MKMDAGDWLILGCLVALAALFVFGIVAVTHDEKELHTGAVVDIFAPPDATEGKIAVRIDDEVFTITTTIGAASQVELGQEVVITVSINIFGNIWLREF